MEKVESRKGDEEKEIGVRETESRRGKDRASGRVCVCLHQEK